MWSGRSGGRAGRGNNRAGSGRSKGPYTSTSKPTKSGLCKALDNHVFEYGHRTAADQTRTSLKKIVQYVGTNYWQDTSHDRETVVRID